MSTLIPSLAVYSPPSTSHRSGLTYDSDQDMSSDPGSTSPAAPARSVPWSAGQVVSNYRGERHQGCPPPVSNDEEHDTRPHPIAPSVISWARECFAGGLTTQPGDLSRLIQEASDAARNDFDEASAIAWANGYEFPQDMVMSDTALLRAHQLDFKAMVRRRLKSLAPNRLNPQRVNGLRDDNPDKYLMGELARGMTVHRPEGFTPNGNLPRTPLRATYVTVAPAVNKMLGDLVEQKLAFILPLEMAQRHVPDLHLCKAHWTRKKGKASGRPLGDLTFVDGTPLNTPETAAAAAAHYGEILHPTIEDISAMVWQFWLKVLKRNPDAQWSDLRIWKMDLKGAYTLICFGPDDAGLFGMLLTGDLVYLQIAGIFGWAGTPAAFQVVTRAIMWELRHTLQSDVMMYVDDIIGVGMADHIQTDLHLTRTVCTNLLGPSAVADDKTEQGRRLDVIGYVIDLDTQRVSISRKNLLSALHGFITVDINGSMTLRIAQRLASQASRYGKICRVMRPFCGALNRLIAGRTSVHAAFLVPEEARIAIKSWQAMLCLVRYDETSFTRTLESFTSSSPTVTAEFDSSLSGTGVIWYHAVHGAEVAVGVCAVSLEFLGFQEDSSYQNLCEFIGAILAVVGHVILGNRGRTLALRGDSVTALTWAITERPRGSIVTNAAMIWTLLCVAADVHIGETTHIPGEQNDNCDQLSRRGLHPTTTVAEHAHAIGIGEAKEIDIAGDEEIMDLIFLCDPRMSIHTDRDFTRFWTAARTIIDRFLERHPAT